MTKMITRAALRMVLLLIGLGAGVLGAGGGAMAQSVPGSAPQVATKPPQPITGPGAANAAPSSSSMPPAVSTSNAESKTTAAPVAGANSFTEAEARRRLESYRYTNVSGLQKDAQSIWRGTAVKDGRPVKVALDYQGNIVAQ